MRTPLNMGRVHAILIWTAFAWAIWNAFFVYVVLGGAQSFRMEAAVFILAALLLPLSWSSASAGSTPRDISVNQARLVIAAAVLTWAVILLPLAGTPLLSEDYGFVERYRSLRDVFGKWQFFRPAFAAVFVILNGAGGGSPLPFHLVSLTLHLTSAWLVQSLVLRLFQSPMLAALTCAVFLLHSVQLEAVLWTAAM